jgi:hypothetical protein
MRRGAQTAQSNTFAMACSQRVQPGHGANPSVNLALFLPLLALLFLLAAPAFAENTNLSIGQDRYEAGDAPVFDTPGVTDLFMAANKVGVAAPIAGSAYLAGRRVRVDAAIGGDLLAAGYSVDVSAPISGNASVTGYEISLGPVAGNLRAAGAEVQVSDVGGYALITGGDVTLNGVIAGDVILAAETIIFGQGARVDGKLRIFAEDPEDITVPTSVATADRVTIEPIKAYSEGEWAKRMPTPEVPVWRIVGGFLAGVVISGLISVLVIAVAPNAVQNWRILALAHPGRAIWSGFLVASALAGSGFVLMLTIIGVFLLPVMLIITLVAIFAGYALGSYVLGVGLWHAIGKQGPDGLPLKFALACLGAFVAGLAWLVPVAGWFFVMGLTLLGIGTLAAFVLPANLLLRRDAKGSAVA